MAHGDRPAVRLTRRGRLAVVSAFLTVFAGAFVMASTPGRAADPGGVTPVAVVGSADTLWSIAERYAPGNDRFETIDEIRRLNGIEDYTVHPGQRLVLPRRR